ncbi:MAG: SinR family protein [Verrucomicrobia bacterium]|nr:SinR family protein [Verrucomicrobiota bacterium]
MKKVLIISYDLTKPGQSYEPLIQRIKGLGDWARLGGSAYLVFTQYTPVQVRDHLWAVIDKSDKIFVGTCPPPAAWEGMPKDVSDWILARMK